MFKNYIKIAIRNFFKFKIFTTINVIGLAIGVTVCLLMLMYVVNEMSFENFHVKKKNIVRISVEWGTKDTKMRFAGSMPALAPALQSAVPEVEKAIRLQADYNAIITNRVQEKIREQNLFFADPEIFDIFSFQLIAGDNAKPLGEPFSIVLSETMAKKYFAESKPIGQEIIYNDTPLKVTAIMLDIPGNTHLKADFMISYSTLEAMGKKVGQPWNQWGDDLTYVLLKDQSSLSVIGQKLNALLLKNTGEWFASRMKFIVQPLTDIHWDNESRGDIGPKGNKMYVYLFLSAAIFVLIIACFNFMNLSASRYLDRVKEVGIRKVVGAQRTELMAQFLIESLMIITISTILGTLSFETLYPYFYAYLETNFVLNKTHFVTLFLIIIGIMALVGLFAGGYPALFLSKFRPIEIMRQETIGLSDKLSIRKILIMLQFSISIILLLGSIIIFRQIDFMKNSDLGFKKENVLLINFPYAAEMVKQKYEVLKNEFLKNPKILDVTGAYTVPGVNSRMNISVRIDGASTENSINLQALPADFGFVKAMGIELISGRDFSQLHSLDKYESVLLNQTAVSALRLKDPIGTRLIIPGEEFQKGVSVIGVVKDFHVQSFHNKINPMLIYVNPKMYILMAVRVNPQNFEETLAYLKNSWKNILSNLNMNYRFLADTYNNLYKSEVKTGQLLSVFTVLALLISCLGLFGLASFLVSKRIKEVGIRKVLGATTSGITVLLSRRIIAWILISSFFACPIAYFLMNKWLQNFAFRIKVEWWIFLIAVCFELTIALLTVSYNTIKTSRANPVQALKYE